MVSDVNIIELDIENVGDVISPLLFGHNLEITRRGIWSGLSAEMVANRKFAAVEGSLPKRWLPVGDSETVHVDTSLAYTGKQCVRINVPANATPAGIMQQHEVLAVQHGKGYTVRVWVKTETARKLRICLTGPDNEPVVDKSCSCKTGDWHLLEVNFKPHATLSNCHLELSSIDPGVFWLGAVSVQPHDAFHGMRRDVIELLKEIKPGCLRFPGGCYEEFYEWEAGLLPVDQRPPLGPTGLWFLLTDTDDYDTHEIGVDEFIALCHEIGSEPAITVRMSEKTPESAAAWVEYCNGDQSTKWGQLRISRGHYMPYNVRWWFVGNEMYAFGRGDVLKAEGYAAQCKLFSEAMKKVDASINLVPCTQFSNGLAWPDWNTPVMNAVSPLMHAGSVHQYMLDQIPLVTAEDYSKVIKTPSSSVVETLKLAKELMDTHQPTDRKLGIVYDEWNLMWGCPGSVPAAVYTAGILNMLCREAEPLGLDMACYFMPVNEGVIKVSPLHAEFDTTGYVFELYKLHQGNRLIRTQIAAVDICTSLTTDGKLLCVTVVNDIVEAKTVCFILQIATLAKRTKASVVHLVPRSLDITESILNRIEEQGLITEDGRVVVTMAPGEIMRVTINLM